MNTAINDSGYGDECLCCGMLLGCYCHEYPHFKLRCPGFYLVPSLDWYVCFTQWGLGMAWRPRGEQAIEFQILCFVFTFFWRPPIRDYVADVVERIAK